MTGNALLLRRAAPPAGFAPFQPERQAGASPAPRRAPVAALGLPDFSAPPPEPVAEAERAAATARAEAAARAAAAEAARLEAVRQDGFAAGKATGLAAAAASQAAREMAALEAIAAALADQHARLERTAEASATALAALLLQALDAALPAASARLAPENAAQLAAALAPLLAEGKAVTLEVGPGLAEAVAVKLADPRLGITEDPTLAPGDARARWRGGGATLSLAARRQAVAALLDAYGLNDPREER